MLCGFDIKQYDFHKHREQLRGSKWLWLWNKILETKRQEKLCSVERPTLMFEIANLRHGSEKKLVRRQEVIMKFSEAREPHRVTLFNALVINRTAWKRLKFFRCCTTKSMKGSDLKLEFWFTDHVVGDRAVVFSFEKSKNGTTDRTPTVQ